MSIQNQETTTSPFMKRKKEYLERRRSSSRNIASFSAKLPDDVVSAFRDCCVCAVKYSTNPSSEIRESIVEMIQIMGIRDWKEMEDLVYCYIALNSTELHCFIEEAFLSLCFFSPSPSSHTIVPSS